MPLFYICDYKMFNANTIKKNLLNATAACGCRKMAMDQIGILYTDLLELEQDQNYARQLATAEKFYGVNLNKILAALAKKRLYETLVNGTTDVITKTTSFTTEDGDTVSKQEITRRYKPASVEAIKVGLSCLPELVKLAESMASHDALNTNQLEALDVALSTIEDNVRNALNGQIENKPLTDEVIGQLQSILLKGG